MENLGKASGPLSRKNTHMYTFMPNSGYNFRGLLGSYQLPWYFIKIVLSINILELPVMNVYYLYFFLYMMIILFLLSSPLYGETYYSKNVNCMLSKSIFFHHELPFIRDKEYKKLLQKGLGVITIEHLLRAQDRARCLIYVISLHSGQRSLTPVEWMWNRRSEILSQSFWVCQTLEPTLFDIMHLLK